MKHFDQLEKKLGITFKNKDLLVQAFAHRSYINENPEFHLSNNERLEFLGDAVIELVVTEELFVKYPGKAEGDLTNWRASLVNAKMLAQVAKELEFEEFLLLSKGEKKENGKARSYILANCFESFVGALYLDLGYEASKEFLKKELMPRLDEIIKGGSYKDAKSKFQECSQEKVSITPSYKVMKEWGPDHNKRFIVGVYLQEELVSEGEGSSKQEAEEEAAKLALKIKNW